MKIIFALLFLLANTAALAGDYYYDARINYYDPINGLYYKAVKMGTEERGFMSKSTDSEVVNLNIFDPSTGLSTLLFTEPQLDGITVIMFETGFKDGRIEFNSSSLSNAVLNNAALLKREPKNKMLVGVRNKKNKEIILFISSKRGEGLAKFVTIPDAADWHIDVKNSKLRVVHQLGNKLKIESYDW